MPKVLTIDKKIRYIVVKERNVFLITIIIKSHNILIRDNERNKNKKYLNVSISF
jgi:hypothetical protein